MNNIIEEGKKEMERAIEHFRMEIGKIRTGRANPGMIENIPVDYYGAKSPLKQVATITAPEARLLVIQPWDRDNLVNIESAIREANLGFNPANDGQVIRISIPALTEELRKELAKVLGKRTEEARIAIRNIREESWKSIQRKEEKGEISEDEKFRGKNKLQETIDGYNSKIEELSSVKEKEIMTI